MTSLISFRKFKGRDIPILTIPKGTCLFRMESSKDNDMNTFAGIYNPKTDSHYLDPNHNVYFYPYPYVVDTVPIGGPWEKNMKIFCVTRDIKVVLLIDPSKFIVDTDKDISIYMRCDHILLWKNKEGHGYDICLSPKFIQKNPDIVGNYRIFPHDMYTLRKYIVQGKMKDFLPFMAFFSDRTKQAGVPEICLYPQEKRTSEPIIRKASEISYRWIYKNHELFNYYPLMIIPHKNLAKDELYILLQNAFSENGYQVGSKNYKFGIDKRTYFYVFPQFVEENTKPFVVNDLRTLRKTNPDLIFKYSKEIKL